MKSTNVWHSIFLSVVLELIYQYCQGFISLPLKIDERKLFCTLMGMGDDLSIEAVPNDSTWCIGKKADLPN